MKTTILNNQSEIINALRYLSLEDKVDIINEIISNTYSYFINMKPSSRIIS